MAEMVIDKAGLVSVDRAEDVLIVDGVRVSMELLAQLAHPNPDRYFRMERIGDEIQVHTLAPSPKEGE